MIKSKNNQTKVCIDNQIVTNLKINQGYLKTLKTLNLLIINILQLREN